MIEVPEDLARLIHEALEEGNWAADPAALADKVRRLDLGLPAEDEFMVLCAWLGKCRLIHKLDQMQLPGASSERYQVPDLLATFTTQAKNGPLLIEVKKKAARTLSFKPDYLAKLQAYADLIGAPLLIAWKFHSLWMLFEAQHLTKAKSNFNISFDRAMKENLLGVLAGDVAYKIGAGAGFHLMIDKEELLETVDADEGRTETWHMRVSDVKFSDRHGNMRDTLSPETQTLFTTWDLEAIEEHADDHIWLRHVAGKEGLQFGHTALVRLLSWHLPDGARLSWRQQFHKADITSLSDFRGALSRGLEEGVVQIILDQVPLTMPDFISSPKTRGAAAGEGGVS